MKKILSFISYSITVFVVNGQTHDILKDTSNVKFNVESNSYRSKTPIFKIPTDSKVHYHMQHKKTDEKHSATMPNAFNYALPLESNTNPKIKRNVVRSISKSSILQDSIFRIQKNVEDYCKLK